MSCVATPVLESKVHGEARLNGTRPAGGRGTSCVDNGGLEGSVWGRGAPQFSLVVSTVRALSAAAV